MSSIATLNLVVFIIETLLYGLVLILSAVVFYLWSRLRTERRLWNPVVLLMLVLLLICSGHWAITVARYISATLGRHSHPTHRGSTFTGIDGFFRTGAALLQKTANVLGLVAMWVGDLMIIHRVWVIWSYSTGVTLLPCATLFAFVCSGIVGLVTLFQEKRFNDATVTANWVLNLSTNLYCTGVIAWRILRMKPERQETARPFMAVLTVIAESAAILAAWSLFFAVTNEIKSEALLIAMNLNPQVIALTNLLIHLRIGMTKAAAPSSFPGVASDKEYNGGVGSRLTMEGVIMTSPGSMFGVALALPEDEELTRKGGHDGDGGSVSTIPEKLEQ